MNIGIVCYASVGGSGIVATELARALAARGHDVHLLSSETPFRFGEYVTGLTFHRVLAPSYPLFREPQYLLSLANRIVQLSRELRLDVVHAHYAIPHATAVYLARQVLRESAGGQALPRIVTTLHGTDITLLGADPSYSEIVAFSIEQSDLVTAVSESLRTETYRSLPVTREIRVIPNFLDCGVYRRLDVAELAARLRRGGPGERLLVHVSNFRPVKQASRVVEIFERVRRRVKARLLLVGDGPELPQALARVRELGLSDPVDALGEHDRVVPLLSASDLFLLPSRQESFGLAALEAMACEVPVVASRVGGLPEIIEHGVSGFLHEPDDIEGMAESAVAVLTDEALHARMAAAARRTVVERFDAALVVPVYEACYAGSP